MRIDLARNTVAVTPRYTDDDLGTLDARRLTPAFHADLAARYTSNVEDALADAGIPADVALAQHTPYPGAEVDIVGEHDWDDAREADDRVREVIAAGDVWTDALRHAEQAAALRGEPVALLP